MMKRMVAIAALALGSVFMTGCAEVVETGHRGLEVTFGEVVSPQPLTEGLHWYNPITSSIVEMDVRTQKATFNTGAYTKDVQQAQLVVSINYNLNPASVKEIYTNVGVDWANKLMPQVVEDSLKTVIGQYVATDLIVNRDTAARKAATMIKERLRERDVLVTAVELSNIDFSNEFEKAVEDKVIAAEQAAAEANRTAQINEQAIQKERMAAAEAQAIREVGDALAKNKDLVALEAVKKWDGKMPVYMLGGGAMPFIDLSPKK